tara:strand:+ start:117 stop:653 length:537 start_codon:yes stop_codon:yes gene_type:complete
MKKPANGYVYVASIKNKPYLCKIGYTRQSPECRVSSLSREYPEYEFELYRAFPFDRPARHELMAHNLLHAKRVDREVFSVTPIEGCIAVQRTVGKHFNQTVNFKSDIDGITEWGSKSPTLHNRIKAYLRYNLELEFVPEPSFDDLKCIVNTYFELHNIMSYTDIDRDLFIELCNEAGL